MSGFDLELLSDDHDRKKFRCGSESLERYLRETAKSHLTKGVSITRVMVERNAQKPKPILGRSETLQGENQILNLKLRPKPPHRD